MNLKKNKCWIFKISLLFWPNNYCAVSQQSIAGISLLNMILSISTDLVIFFFKISAFCTHCPLKQVEFGVVIWNALYIVSLSLLFMGTLRLRCSIQHLTAGGCSGGGLLEKDAHSGVWKEAFNTELMQSESHVSLKDGDWTFGKAWTTAFVIVDRSRL